jgi:hypothetical protein
MLPLQTTAAFHVLPPDAVIAPAQAHAPVFFLALLFVMFLVPVVPVPVSVAVPVPVSVLGAVLLFVLVAVIDEGLEEAEHV